MKDLKKCKVLLIGDSCIDNYKIGTVDRLSPEAPVPVIKIINEYSLPGMAANVRCNLTNLGIDADFITNNQEITKTRYIDQRSGQHLLRVDTDPYISPWTGRSSCPIDFYDAIIISDYNKGFLTYENIEHIINTASCPIFIDTKKDNLSSFGKGNVYIKINEIEFNNLFSYSGNLIVTLGERGAMFGSKHFPTKPVEVMDVCGCGDTFLSALTFRYLQTNDIDNSIMFANTAAGITARHRGNYSPTLKEIEDIHGR